MSVTFTLDTRAEELLAAQLSTGRYGSPEEVVTRALETLAEKESPPHQPRKTVAEAIDHIRASRKGVTLGGLKVKDLIHEGHNY